MKEEKITTIVPFKISFKYYILTFFLITYIVSPIDFFPDFFGIYGILDDLIAFFLLFKLFKHAEYYGEKFYFKLRIFAFFTVILEILLAVYFFVLRK